MELLVDRDFVPGATLCEEESAHCVRVLRHRVGDEVFVTDGEGRKFRCRITLADAKGCALDVLETEVVAPARHELHMAVAPTKNIDRFEWFVEKAVEMGVGKITPIICDHSERVRLRLDRLERLVVAACKQSLKYYLPEICEPVSCKELISNASEYQRFILHCEEGEKGEKAHLFNVVEPCKSSLVLVGPEGDFSKEEILLALAKGFRECTLGEERLRTETAGVVATHIVDLKNQLM